MKKGVIALFVLAMATVADAELKISVNGVVDVPDTQICLMPSDCVVIDIWSDGQTRSGGFFLRVQGPTTVDITEATNTVNPPGYPDTILIWGEGPDAGDIFMDLAIVRVPIPNLPQGKLVDNIRLTCEAMGDVTLILRDFFGDRVFDTQVIHQIPEPMTLALLGLGGLFLRRRK